MDQTNQRTPSVPVITTQGDPSSLLTTQKNPLEIPEILAFVAKFFTSERNWDRHQWTKRGNLQSLLSFIRVSKLWNNIFHPILWHSSDYIHRFTKQSISINSFNLKVLRVTFEDLMPFHCTRLETLCLKRLKSSDHADIQKMRQLVQSNHELKTLHFEGFLLKELGVEEFAELERVQDLKIFGYYTDETPFIEALHPMANSLRQLHLGWIVDVTGGTPREISNNSGTRVNFSQLEEIKLDQHTLQGGRPTSSRFLSKNLVIHSPSLKRLGFSLDGEEDQAQLALCLREFCPLLQDLEIYSVHRQPESSSLANLIQDSSVAGLAKLSVSHALWSQDFFSAILFHSGTLTELSLIWGWEFRTFGASRVLQLLVECRRLKKMKISDVPTNCHKILDEWQTREWGCSQLEIFEFELSMWGTNDEVYLEYAGGDDATVQIVSADLVASWKRQTPQEFLMGVIQSSPRSLGRLFVLLQRLDHVHTLIFDSVRYSRTIPPPPSIQPVQDTD
ncbi:hypothetical protein BGW39_000438 [Mortierella sp. 14UC]|nr:hypothetical protein BGW39_000438 [Mortierella sp. 14UC]